MLLQLFSKSNLDTCSVLSFHFFKQLADPTKQPKTFFEPTNNEIAAEKITTSKEHKKNIKNSSCLEQWRAQQFIWGVLNY